MKHCIQFNDTFNIQKYFTCFAPIQISFLTSIMKIEDRFFLLVLLLDKYSDYGLKDLLFHPLHNSLRYKLII